ncbi:MAG: betaine-aldehyde dehydrogenase [Hyphomonadaceae bacterium]|nr:betaine-aldehyde dehydrogenase [Hyphomonadaceae bacterium]
MYPHQPEGSHFVEGAYRDDREGTPFQSCFPADGRVIARLHVATPAILDHAIHSAQNAQAIWRTTSLSERQQVLRRVAEILRDRNDELARLETFDTGKPISETLVSDPASAAECFEYYSALSPTALQGSTEQTDTGTIKVLKEPLGVCVGIGAWNYPIQIAGWKAAPALLCGNAMIFKPSETTPLSALKLAEIIAEAGAPAGLFNVVQGDGKVGQWLVEHPGVAKVSLTGSVATGKKIHAAATAQLKHVSLELGGKSPLIVFDDADLEAAVEGAAAGNFYSSGQICSNCTRIYVQRSAFDRFLELFIARAESMKMGDPLDPETEIGPLVSEHHAESVRTYIELGLSEGATCVSGGPNSVSMAADGTYVRPTIFTDVREAMRIAREEIFGPVACVMMFDTEEEVIGRANATELGLAAGIYTGDNGRAERVAHQLQAGICWINTYNEYPIAMPFGGYKQSGLGRENGLLVLDHYTQTKSILTQSR